MHHLIAAIVLGVVERLIGMPQNVDRRIAGVNAGEADADGDAADLREGMGLHRDPEPLGHHVRLFQCGRPQQHHEFLAAEAENPVHGAE